MTTGAPTQAREATTAAGALVAELVAAGLEPEADARRIAEYSYDASNYRVVPHAVLFPRSETEVAAALAPAPTPAADSTVADPAAAGPATAPRAITEFDFPA